MHNRRICGYRSPQQWGYTGHGALSCKQCDVLCIVMLLAHNWCRISVARTFCNEPTCIARNPVCTCLTYTRVVHHKKRDTQMDTRFIEIMRTSEAQVVCSSSACGYQVFCSSLILYIRLPAVPDTCALMYCNFLKCNCSLLFNFLQSYIFSPVCSPASYIIALQEQRVWFFCNINWVLFLLSGCKVL